MIKQIEKIILKNFMLLQIEEKCIACKLVNNYKINEKIIRREQLKLYLKYSNLISQQIENLIKHNKILEE